MINQFFSNEFTPKSDRRNFTDLCGTTCVVLEFWKSSTIWCQGCSGFWVLAMACRIWSLDKNIIHAICYPFRIYLCWFSRQLNDRELDTSLSCPYSTSKNFIHLDLLDPIFFSPQNLDDCCWKRCRNIKFIYSERNNVNTYDQNPCRNRFTYFFIVIKNKRIYLKFDAIQITKSDRIAIGRSELFSNSGIRFYCVLFFFWTIANEALM